MVNEIKLTNKQNNTAIKKSEVPKEYMLKIVVDFQMFLKTLPSSAHLSLHLKLYLSAFSLFLSSL